MPRPGNYAVELSLATIPPADRVLTIQCGDHVEQVNYADRGGNLTVQCYTASETVHVELSIPTVNVPGGGRTLGVSVLDAQVEALDRGTIWLFRAAAAITCLAAVVGGALAASALARRRIWLAAGGGLVALAVLLAIDRYAPEAMLAAVAGPAGLLALASGLTAWALASGRRPVALAAALATPLIVLLVTPEPVSILLTGLWSARDVDAMLVLPWLAVIGTVTAALIGGRRAAWVAAASSLIALLAIGAPAVTRQIVERWRPELAVPAWEDIGSAPGAAYVIGAFVLVGLATAATASRRERPALAVGLVVGLGVLSLLVWRAQAMNFNGDEPHYYVTARSIGTDQDLELLDDYQERSYHEVTISPVGNVAVIRDDAPGRYTSVMPAPTDSWWLIPELGDGWSTGAAGAGIRAASGDQPEMWAPDGSRGRLPPLVSGESLSLTLPSPCRLERIWVGSPSGDVSGARVTVRDAAGQEIWSGDVDLGTGIGEAELPEGGLTCDANVPLSVGVESFGGPVVAMAADTFEGLRVIPGREPSAGTMLVGLPRDHYASRRVNTRVAFHNPGEEPIFATARVVSDTGLAMMTFTVGIPAGGSSQELIAVAGGEAILVQALGPVVVEAAGQVVDQRYNLVTPAATGRWLAPVRAAPDRDAGLWLTVANPDNDSIRAVVRDGALVYDVWLCGFCAETLFFEAGEVTRHIELDAPGDSAVVVGGVEYEERTGRLHFDVALPLLAAPLAALSSPWLVLLLPALAAVLMAVGAYHLLRALELSGTFATTGAVATAMLAPMSPYAVRLYTEIFAATLLIWALVFWTWAQERRGWYVPAFLIVLVLPVLHGRLTPLAVGMALLLLGSLLNGRLPGADWRAWLTRRRAAYAGAIVAALVVGLVLVAQFAVALSVRGTLRYFEAEWVPYNLAGILLDRGSGIIPFAPWCLLAFAAPRPLARLQRGALALFLLNLTVIALRVGGWQTWGAPSRYMLPVVTLLMLLAVPGAARLWRSGALGRLVVLVIGAWSVLATFMLHWMPLSGYVRGDQYLIDQAFDEVFGRSPAWMFPTVAPQPGAQLLGYLILAVVVVLVVWVIHPHFRRGYVASSEAGRE